MSLPCSNILLMAPWHQLSTRRTPTCSTPQLQEEEADYKEAVAAGPAIPRGAPCDLGMRVLLVHGDEHIADSTADGGLAPACDKFKTWVDKAFPRSA